MSNSQSEEIRNRVNIVDVVSEYVPLKRSGRNYTGLCPFHSEKTPSFTVSEEKQIFHCFGCGAGGDVFSFVMKHENLSFYEALKTLARRLGIELKVGEKAKGGRLEACYALNKKAMEFYHDYLLKSPRAESARGYLKKRGFDGRIVKDFSIGYADGGGKVFASYLKAHGIPAETAQKAGLITMKGNTSYDLFRARIIFPIFDVSSRVIGFGGRVIGEGMPKYLNTPESPVFRKREALYGLNLSKGCFSKEDSVLVVEGYFDLLALYKHGIKNVVATLGTALTQEHIRRLKRYVTTVIPLFDSDEAGRKAALRAVDLFIEEDVNAKVCLLPEGVDPDEFVFKEGKEGMDDCINKAVPLINFFLQESSKGLDLKDLHVKASFIEKTADTLSRIKNPVKRGLYIRKVSEDFNIDESLVISAFNRSFKKLHTKGKPEGEVAVIPLNKGFNPDEVIIWALFNLPEVMGSQSASIIDDLEDEGIKRLGRTAIEQSSEDRRKKGIMDFIDDESLKGRLAHIALYCEGMEKETLAKMIDDYIKAVKLKRLRREKELLIQEIRESEKEGETERLYTLLKRKQELMRIERSPDVLLKFRWG